MSIAMFEIANFDVLMPYSMINFLNLKHYPDHSGKSRKPQAENTSPELRLNKQLTKSEP